MKNTQTISQIRQQLAEYLDDPGQGMDSISMNAAARGIGRSTAAISQFLGNKYTGDNERLANQISSWLKRQQERRRHNEIFTETVPTFAVNKVKKTCRIAHIQGEMAAITGPSGVGKTRGLKAYAAENPDVIYVRVIPCYSMRDLMSEIHKRVKGNGEGRATDMAEFIIEKLMGSGRLIIIDEAEHLPYKALEMVRTIYDLAGVGIVLGGMPHLIINMKGTKGQYKQLYSRIAIHAEIPPMTGDHEKDIQALVMNAIPNSNGIWKEFAEHSRGNARQLEKLVKMSVQISAINDSEITAQIIKKAKTMIIT